MARYELAEYVQEYLAEDGVNVDCVGSGRARADAGVRVRSCLVDLHNSRHFDSHRWNGRADAPGHPGGLSRLPDPVKRSDLC